MEITILAGITSIDEYVFSGCNRLTELTIPDGVTSIGKYAFNKCSELAKITIPDGVTSIGSYAFFNCTGLTEIVIPTGVTSISDYVFCYCSALTEITIPDGVTSIGTRAFYYCSGLTKLIIPFGVTSIESYAFYHCSEQMEVYYSGSEDDWTSIEIGSNNTSLTNATIYYNSIGPDDVDDEDDPYNPDESEEIRQDSFYIDLDYVVIGQEDRLIDFYYKTIDEDADYDEDLDAIVWESSNTDIAEVEYTHGNYYSTSSGVAGTLDITAKKPGLVTITGTTSDGRIASKTISVEPEMIMENYLSATIGTELSCSVSLDESDADYLEWFMNEITYSTSGTKMLFEGSYEVSEDGCTAVYTLEVTSIYVDYGLSDTSTLIFTSYGGQTVSDKMSVSIGDAASNLGSSDDDPLNEEIEAWYEAYENYVKVVKETLQNYINSSATANRETSILNGKKKMMEWDDDSSNKYKYISSSGNIDEDMKDAEYEALSTYLYDNIVQAAVELELSSITAKDSNASKIISKLMKALSAESETYYNDSITVTISGNFSSTVGYASITCTKLSDSYITDKAVFCSSPSDCEQALENYLEELDGLEVTAIEQATVELCNSVCKVVLDKSLKDITEEFLVKELKDHTEELMEIGVGDMLTILNNSYKYNTFIGKIKGVLTANEDPENIYEAMTLITFKDDDIYEQAVKKALKLLNKATNKLNNAFYAEMNGEESDSALDRLKAIFSCPVDVSVYSSDGTQIGYVGDDDIWYTEDLIDIEVRGDAKIITSYTDDILSFTLTSTGYGTLGYSFEEYDETGSTIGRSNFYDIFLYTGQVLEVTSTEGKADGSASSYTVTTDDQVIAADEYISASDNAVIYVECDITGEDTVYGIGQYVRGDAAVVSATSATGYRFVGWYQNETIVSTSEVYEFTAKSDTELSAVFAEYAVDISSCTITLSADSYVYDGTEKTPDVSVVYDDEELVEGTDYVVTYANNAEAGTATVTVTGIWAYDGSASKDFTITNSGEGDIHVYGDPVFNWAEDYSACEAVFTCSDNDDTQTVECDVTSQTTSAGCTEDGQTVYTAACTFNGETYSDQVTVETQATGHEYQYADNGDGSTHTITCKNCDYEEIATHTFENGACTLCGAEQTEEHVHVYGEPSFDWSEDMETCKAVFTCTDNDNTLEVDCTVTKKTTKEATCTEAGEITCTATCTFNGKTYQDVQKKTVNALGHKTEVQNAKEATCTEKGYTGDKVCTVCGTTVEKGKDIAAKGHSYQYTDNKDGKTHTVTCKNCDYSATENHTYKNGKCTKCGAAEPAAETETISVPTSLKVKNAAKGIKITWSSVKGAEGYYIYRSVNGGKFTKIAATDNCSYTDKTVVNGKFYSYKVYAYKGETVSKASSAKSTFYLSASGTFKLSNLKGYKLNITWKKNAKANGYQIQYATKSDFTNAKTVTVTSKNLSKSILKLKANKKYYVRIRSYKKYGTTKYYSAWSSKDTVKIKK
ncbi:MAG: fibronectin type III domain-containing protein [Clostridiales bacterium]|nr:fibronectin type III domain-containing protein [Clostridiales bacterium]